ncbi:YicC/YloC family endoribonuclease [Roseinatronobacter sp. S2]|uniref:YicC/YloC family endoribonuclease n=1 Tax=Roseinatronobacter sp. S2 TaxID=3035471 RepID=UPI00240F5316|nr:YicC/YloC family endoribonuclease [Roseinatronobacter sp. S2]WFE76343.1 YicC family protein [Roseinatronobacter sp. S2]
MYSMTGFASKSTATAIDGVDLDLEWDMRSVNGRGLDVRLRLPEGIGFIEKKLRDRLAACVSRGNVTVTLKASFRGVTSIGMIDHTVLDAVLAGMTAVTAKAQSIGVQLSAPSALDVLAWRSVMPSGHDFAAFDTANLGQIVAQDFELLLHDFNAMRLSEGQKLAQVIDAMLDRIDALTMAARDLLPERRRALAEAMRKAAEHLTEAVRPDGARIEQELALIAIKADVTEELDRLSAHCDAAKDLLQQDGGIGRRLDFLTQEFNREANTLCSKAQHLGLSRIGLELKAVIDQMREQVQNLE